MNIGFKGIEFYDQSHFRYNNVAETRAKELIRKRGRAKTDFIHPEPLQSQINPNKYYVVSNRHTEDYTAWTQGGYQPSDIDSFVELREGLGTQVVNRSLEKR